MGRHDDDSSVVTVSFDDGNPSHKGAGLSQKKLEQLAAAREKALLKRRAKLKDKLQTKLNELHHILGSDMRSGTLERVAEAMLKQEQRLRDRQNELTEQLIETIRDFKVDLASLKEQNRKPAQHAAAPPPPRPVSRPKPRPTSEASSTGSGGRTLTLAM